MAVDSAVALITLAQAKTHLKITASSEDTLLEQMINRAGQVCNTYTGRHLKTATWTEYYNGNGNRTLELSNFPITSVTSVNVDSTRQWASSTAIDTDEDLIVDAPAGIIKLWNNGGLFYAGFGNVKVVYVAGYTDSGDNAVPYDLQEAALLILQLSYKRHYQDQRIGISSETVGDRTYNYSDDDIPKKAKMILDSYRDLGRSEFISQVGSMTTPPSTDQNAGTFGNSDLVSNIFTITHNLGLDAPYTIQVAIFNNSGIQITPDQIIGSANSVAIDLTSFAPLTGTWGYSYL